MTPSRRLRTTGTDAERLLLAAGSAEKPDAQAVRRAAEGLGILPKALFAGAAMWLALRASRWTSLAARSLLPVGGAGAIAVAAYGVSHRAAVVEIAPPNAVASVAVSGKVFGRPGDAPVAVAPVVAEERAPASGPVAPAEARKTIARRAAPVAVLSADRLREQAEALDRARAQLQGGDAAAALASLDDFDRKFASTPLSEEALLLRVEAVAQRGDKAAAATLARRFLRAYPASVHAARVTSLLHGYFP